MEHLLKAVGSPCLLYTSILPILDESVPVISVTKGMLDYEDGTMQTYPEYWMSKLPEGSKQEILSLIHI